MARNNSLAYPTPDEMLAVLKVARQRSSRDWAMILLAYRHGMRASEVCGLEMRDLDMRNGSITIRRLNGSLTSIQPLYPHRGMPLLDEIVALRTWLKDRYQDGSPYVFTSQKGGRLHRAQFFRIFQSIGEAAGLPGEKRHPHVLKHALGSHLVASNVNLALVKQALGHRSIHSTMMYVGTTDRQAAEAVQGALMSIF